jgi:hypothetical protein
VDRIDTGQRLYLELSFPILWIPFDDADSLDDFVSVSSDGGITCADGGFGGSFFLLYLDTKLAVDKCSPLAPNEPPAVDQDQSGASFLSLLGLLGVAAIGMVVNSAV